MHSNGTCPYCGLIGYMGYKPVYLSGETTKDHVFELIDETNQNSAVICPECGAKFHSQVF